MSDVTSIPLNKLVAWDGNLRETACADTVLHELASSIASHGVINNLVVKPHRKDSYAVLTTGRRFTAVQLLVKNGKLARVSSRQVRTLGQSGQCA